LGEELIFPAAEITTCRLYTERYVEINGNPYLLDGNLKVSRLWGSGSVVGAPRSIAVNRTQLRSFPGDPDKSVPRVQIVVGDEAVRNWFRKRGPAYEGILEKAADLLEHEIPPTEEELAELKKEQENCLAQLEETANTLEQLWEAAQPYIEQGRGASREPRRRVAAKEDELHVLLERAVGLGIAWEDLDQYA
jgi:hypothetical protein